MTREIPIPDLSPPEVPSIEVPAIELPESAMSECRISTYIPVSAFDPKTQAELIAVNIVQVRTDRDLCRKKHSALVEWILSTHR